MRLARLKNLFAIVPLMLPCACRTPADPEPPPLYIEDFDTSLPDGGEPAPVAPCAEDGRFEFNNNFSPYFGGEVSADAEVVHFSSFYCSHCADFAAYTKARWGARSDYEDRVRIYFHHANLGYRHRAAVAVANQGVENFWKLHDFIYTEMLSSGGPSDAAVRAYAENELDLDMARFDDDVDAHETDAFLKWDANQGFSSGLTGTPAVYLCGDKVDNWTYLEDHIDAVL